MRRPLDDVLPAIVPVGRFLVRDEPLMIALSVESPELGIEAASCLLDGAAVVNASAAAQPYWQ